MRKVIAQVGTEHVNLDNLKAIEAVSMSVVAILAVTIGTIYGSML